MATTRRETTSPSSDVNEQEIDQLIQSLNETQRAVYGLMSLFPQDAWRQEEMENTLALLKTLGITIFEVPEHELTDIILGCKTEGLSSSEIATKIKDNYKCPPPKNILENAIGLVRMLHLAIVASVFSAEKTVAEMANDVGVNLRNCLTAAVSGKAITPSTEAMTTLWDQLNERIRSGNIPTAEEQPTVIPHAVYHLLEGARAPWTCAALTLRLGWLEQQWGDEDRMTRLFLDLKAVVNALPSEGEDVISVLNELSHVLTISQRLWDQDEVDCVSDFRSLLIGHLSSPDVHPLLRPLLREAACAESNGKPDEVWLPLMQHRSMSLEEMTFNHNVTHVESLNDNIHVAVCTGCKIIIMDVSNWEQKWVLDGHDSRAVVNKVLALPVPPNGGLPMLVSSSEHDGTICLWRPRIDGNGYCTDNMQILLEHDFCRVISVVALPASADNAEALPTLVISSNMGLHVFQPTTDNTCYDVDNAKRLAQGNYMFMIPPAPDRCVSSLISSGSGRHGQLDPRRVTIYNSNNARGFCLWDSRDDEDCYDSDYDCREDDWEERLVSNVKVVGTLPTAPDSNPRLVSWDRVSRNDEGALTEWIPDADGSNYSLSTWYIKGIVMAVFELLTVSGSETMVVYKNDQEKVLHVTRLSLIKEQQWPIQKSKLAKLQYNSRMTGLIILPTSNEERLSTLVSEHDSGELCVWYPHELGNQYDPSSMQTLVAPTNATVHCILPLNDDKSRLPVLVSCYSDGTLCIWQPNDGGTQYDLNKTKVLPGPHSLSGVVIHTPANCSDNYSLLSWSERRNKLRKWNITANTLSHEMAIKQLPARRNSIGGLGMASVLGKLVLPPSFGFKGKLPTLVSWSSDQTQLYVWHSLPDGSGYDLARTQALDSVPISPRCVITTELLIPDSAETQPVLVAYYQCDNPSSTVWGVNAATRQFEPLTLTKQQQEFIQHCNIVANSQTTNLALRLGPDIKVQFSCIDGRDFPVAYFLRSNHTNELCCPEPHDKPLSGFPLPSELLFVEIGQYLNPLDQVALALTCMQTYALFADTSLLAAFRYQPRLPLDPSDTGSGEESEYDNRSVQAGTQASSGCATTTTSSPIATGISPAENTTNNMPQTDTSEALCSRGLFGESENISGDENNSRHDVVSHQ